MMETTELIKPRSRFRSSTKTIRLKLFIFKILYEFQYEIYAATDDQYIYKQMKKLYSNGSVHLNESDTVINRTQFEGKCTVNNKSFSETKAQDETATLEQYDEMISSGLSIIVIIILGPMTDILGRKFLLLWVVTMALIGLGIRTVVVFSQSPIYFLLITSTFLGLAGTRYTFDLTITGIIADTTSRNKQRSFVMVLMGAGGSIGSFTAQIFTGYAIPSFGFLPQYPICVGVLLILITGIHFLQENQRAKRQYISKFSRCWQSQIWTICSDRIGKRKHVFAWLFAFLVLKFATTAYDPIRELYQLGSPFCWSAERGGWNSAVISIAQFVFGPLIITIFQRFMADEYVLQISIMSRVLCLVIYGVATQSWMLYTIIGFDVVAYSGETMINAILSRRVNPEKQGTLFSVVAILDSSVKLGGVPIFSSIYKQTRPIYKGFVFFVMALFLILASVFSLYILKMTLLEAFLLYHSRSLQKVILHEISYIRKA